MNVQTLPRSDKVVKRAFIPKLDALLFADYMQIELRLLAYYMARLGDDSMARAIKAGTDLHTVSAKGALKLTREPDDEERQVGKTLNFSIVYGGGTPTLMKQLGVTYNEAREILRNYHAQWPGIGLVQNKLKGRVQQRGYVTTLWGRHLHLEENGEHKLLNKLIQGCAADLMKQALVQTHGFLREGGFDSHLVNVIHDELVIDAGLDEIDFIVPELPRLMGEPRVEELVPVGIDVEWSTTNWAEKSAYDRKEDGGRDRGDLRERVA